MATEELQPAGADPEEWARQQAMKHLAKHYYGPLMRYFRRRVGERAEAEDLTQDVFLKMSALVNINRLENVEAFLFTVAANLLRDRWRQSGTREAVISDSTSVGWETSDDLQNPDRQLQARQQLAAVLDMMEHKLSAQARNIFILARLENMKQQDIAELYGISRSAVEKHIVRVLAQLAKNLGHLS